MSHPLVVTLDRKSAPRTIFYGDRLLEVDMPVGKPYSKVDGAVAAEPLRGIAVGVEHEKSPHVIHAAIILPLRPV